jgi:hypothetical protein
MSPSKRASDRTRRLLRENLQGYPSGTPFWLSHGDDGSLLEFDDGGQIRLASEALQAVLLPETIAQVEDRTWLAILEEIIKTNNPKYARSLR